MKVALSLHPLSIYTHTTYKVFKFDPRCLLRCWIASFCHFLEYFMKKKSMNINILLV